MDNLSLVSKVGVLLYVAVAFWTAATGLRLRRSRRVGGGGGLWLGIAGVMVALAAWRASMAEPRLLAWGRSLALARGEYDARQALQAPTVAAGLLAFAVLLYLFLHRRALTPRLLAALSAGALLALIGVRLVSLHATDALLYAQLGPLNFNQLLEAALLGAIVVGAWLDRRRARPSMPR